MHVEEAALEVVLVAGTPEVPLPRIVVELGNGKDEKPVAERVETELRKPLLGANKLLNPVEEEMEVEFVKTDPPVAGKELLKTRPVDERPDDAGKKEMEVPLAVGSRGVTVDKEGIKRPVDRGMVETVLMLKGKVVVLSVTLGPTRVGSRAPELGIEVILEVGNGAEGLTVVRPPVGRLLKPPDGEIELKLKLDKGGEVPKLGIVDMKDELVKIAADGSLPETSVFATLGSVVTEINTNLEGEEETVARGIGGTVVVTVAIPKETLFERVVTW